MIQLLQVENINATIRAVGDQPEDDASFLTCAANSDRTASGRISCSCTMRENLKVRFFLAPPQSKRGLTYLYLHLEKQGGGTDARILTNGHRSNGAAQDPFIPVPS